MGYYPTLKVAKNRKRIFLLHILTQLHDHRGCMGRFYFSPDENMSWIYFGYFDPNHDPVAWPYRGCMGRFLFAQFKCINSEFNLFATISSWGKVAKKEYFCYIFWPSCMTTEDVWEGRPCSGSLTPTCRGAPRQAPLFHHWNTLQIQIQIQIQRHKYRQG